MAQLSSDGNILESKYQAGLPLTIANCPHTRFVWHGIFAGPIAFVGAEKISRCFTCSAAISSISEYKDICR